MLWLMTYSYFFECTNPSCAFTFELVQWGDFWLDANGDYGRIYPMSEKGDFPDDSMVVNGSSGLCTRCGEIYIAFQEPFSLNTPLEKESWQERVTKARNVVPWNGGHQESSKIADRMQLLFLDARCPECEHGLMSGSELLLHVGNRHENTSAFGIPPLDGSEDPQECPRCKKVPLAFKSWMRY